MKIELKSNYIPLVDWLDLSKDSFYSSIANEFSAKKCMVFHPDEDIDEDEYHSFIFFKDYEKKMLYKGFIGRVKYLGRCIDEESKFREAYGFYPEGEIKISRIGIDEDFRLPNSVFIKQKKL